jgi:hypothetical protein
LPGAATWIAPELCPTCSPRLPSPANVVLDIDLVRVGRRALCKHRQLLWRARLSVTAGVVAAGWAGLLRLDWRFS